MLQACISIWELGAWLHMGAWVAFFVLGRLCCKEDDVEFGKRFFFFFSYGRFRVGVVVAYAIDRHRRHSVGEWMHGHVGKLGHFEMPISKWGQQYNDWVQ
jgi:hypothetical protein